MAKTTSDPRIAARLIEAAADLKDQAGELAPASAEALDMLTEEATLPGRLSEQQAMIVLRRCSTCAGFARRIHQFPDLRRGKAVGLYQCQHCGRSNIWEDCEAA